MPTGYSVIVPPRSAVPSLPADSANHSRKFAPSHQMPPSPAFGVGTVVSVIVPFSATRPIVSGSSVMNSGAPELGRPVYVMWRGDLPLGTGYSTNVPEEE